MSASFFMLVLLGFGIGTIGTLIGVGGGFILVPIFIMSYPNLDTQSITAISMALVAANALSGSFSYVRSGRVDYKTAVVFALATLPGSVLGVLATEIIPRYFFDLIFGVVLMMLSLFLFFKGGQKREYAIHKKTAGQTYRKITDRYGETFEYSYSMKYGIILSVFCWILFSFARHWRRHYSCARIGGMVSVSAEYCYGNFSFYSGNYDGNKCYSSLF